MQRSGSQKALLVFSILMIIEAVLELLAAFGTFFATGMLAAETSSLAESGLSQSDQATGAALFGILSIVLIVSGVWSLLCGIFGIRAANDNQKIMVVWVFTLIGIILEILSLVMAIMNGSFGSDAVSLIIGLVFAVLMFWLANNIKREAGK